MNKKVKIILLLISILYNSVLLAQTNQRQEVEQQIKEFMKARDEMIKSLINDSDFQNFDQQFENLAKKFNKDSFSGWPDVGGGVEIGEYDWRENATHKIFVLKVKQIKNKPLDIKIEKGQIKLKGDVESVEQNNSKFKRITKAHFERIFSIPNDVDRNDPEFENKAGELLIKFKKLKSSKSPSKSNTNNIGEPNQPIEKDPKDLTI